MKTKKLKLNEAAQQQRPTERQADELRQIPRRDIYPDASQPRKTFDEAGLKELAESIKVQGIVQPLIVRLQKAEFRIQEPDLTSSDYRLEKRVNGEWMQLDMCDEKNHKKLRETWAGNFGGLGTEMDYQDRYVLVAGERRWRASGPDFANLDTLPCIVRDVAGHSVFAQQWIENEQRVNITALEEAAALQGQLESRRNEAEGGTATFSVEDLAKELGMSRAGLYARLALNRLHAPVREALLAGKISASVAGVVAIVPLPNQQEKLLKEITNEEAWNFPFSVRDVQEMVDDEYCKQLKDAPFDTKLTYGDSVTGILEPCTGCPHRTGNMVEQFPELKARPNACTRPDCFAQKCKSHWLAKAENAKARGKEVLTPAEFKKVKADYVRADKQCSMFEDRYWQSPAELLGKHAPEPTLVATADGLEKYFKKVDIEPAAKKAKVKLAGGRNGQAAETPEAKAKREAKEKAETQRRDRQAVFAETLVPRFAKALDALRDKEAWALLGEDVRPDSWEKSKNKILSQVKSDKGRVLVEGLWYQLDDLFDGRGDEGDAIKIFKRVGIDFKAEFEAEEKKAQASLALPAKGKAEQKELLAVKPNKKKGGRK